jgi:hypothetical protein
MIAAIEGERKGNEGEAQLAEVLEALSGLAPNDSDLTRRRAAPVSQVGD